MSFPQLGYPQFLSAAAQDVYGGGERPGSAAAREGAAESGLNSSVAAAAVGSMLGMYGNPWTAAHNYSAFLPYGGAADLALISQMGSQYDLKDGPGGHPALPVHATQGFYPYGQYPYGDPSRAKTATRETTSTLKAWLQEHQKNPYPTKGEKIMLAIITKMTLTQVSTWFANARRRLKKENKVTWGRSAEDRDGRIFSSDNEDEEHGKSDEEEDEEIDLETVDPERPAGMDESDRVQAPVVVGGTEPCSGEEEGLITGHRESSNKTPEGHCRTLSGGGVREEPISLIKTPKLAAMDNSPGRHETSCQSRPAQAKPKIWSLAETATSPDSATTTATTHIRAPSAGHLSPHSPALNPGAHHHPAHPALLPAAHHGIYTCQIGKLHNWTSAAFLNANSLLNMRSLLGGHHHHHHNHHHHSNNNNNNPAGHLPLHHGHSSPGARLVHVAGPGASGTEDESDEESSGSCSPKRDDEESDHRPDSPKSSFRLIADRPHHGAAAQQRVLTTTL